MNGLIAWFARNSVAANLLMAVIVLTGLYVMLTQVPVESSPQYERKRLYVKFAYPGGTPEDIEQSIVTRVEDAIHDLPGIVEMRATANESLGSVTMQVANGFKYREVMDDIKVRVDAIRSFPDELEDLEVGVMSRSFEVISVAVYGDLPERELRVLGKTVEEELAAIAEISQVILTGIRPYEISIDVSEQTLRQYGLTLADVGEAIRRSSIDIPAGSIKTGDNEVLVRTTGQAYTGEEFGNILVKKRVDGTRLRVKDIAEIRDGFEELPLLSRFNGKPAVVIEVHRLGDQDAIAIAKQVRDYIAKVRRRMPAGVEIDYWRDRSRYIDNRINALIANALTGAALVFILLTLFLRLQVALWVIVGIPVSLIGAFTFMPMFDVTINYTSMFAFILIIGIVVDDAIVTGENIYTHLERGGDPTEAVIRGTREVSTAVTFGVLTTVVAFGALLFMEGERSKMFTMIPLIVIPVLLLSLIETKLILPSHLKHIRTDHHIPLLAALQQRFATAMDGAIQRCYQPLLTRSLNRPGLTLAIFIAILLVLGSTLASGWVRFTFFPRVQSEVARANLTLPVGTPYEVTKRYIQRFEQAALKMRDKYTDADTGEQIITNIYSTVTVAGSVRMSRSSNIGRVMFEIVPPEARHHDVTSMELAREWRRRVGPIPGAKQNSFTAYIFSGSAPIDIVLKGQDFKQLNTLAQQIKAHLARYPGVFDIADDYEFGKEQVRLKIKPEAELLGLSTFDLALQVRRAFHGQEVQRVQRGQDEVKVFVRFPSHERASLANLGSMYIRTPDGSQIPIQEVADVAFVQGPASIHHTERMRTIHVTADVNRDSVRLPNLRAEIRDTIDGLLVDHHGVLYSLEGEAKETRQSFRSLGWGMALVLFIMYAMLAMPFRSYWQPFIVMSVIPFGLLGAVLGHLILGMHLTIQSVLGMLALTGVVVNDSLVLVDYINRRRAQGMELVDAIRDSGRNRFRPIWLTSLTTFIGLLPLIFTDNTQAQFLVPMAVSLGFGVLFATFITLLLVPCVYLLFERVKEFFVETESVQEA